MMKAKIIFASLVFSVASLLAPERNWHLTLANGETISSLSLQQLAGDSLAVAHSEQTRWIAVAAIVHMRKERNSKFWKGAGIGFFVGAGAGALIARATYS